MICLLAITREFRIKGTEQLPICYAVITEMNLVNSTNVILNGILCLLLILYHIIFFLQILWFSLIHIPPRFVL